MLEFQSRNVVQEYKLFWDDMDTFKITYTDSGDQTFIVEVNLGEKECILE